MDYTVALEVAKISDLGNKLTTIRSLIPPNFYISITRFNGLILRSRKVVNRVYQANYKEILKLSADDYLEIIEVEDISKVTDPLIGRGIPLNLRSKFKNMLGGMTFTHNDDTLVFIYNEYNNSSNGLLLTIIKERCDND
jgi:hypothetical protein